MATRTTESKVKAIVDVLPGTDVTPFLEAANTLVTEVCTKVEYGYTLSRLTQIETWLAAHFYCIYDPRAFQEQAGPVQQTTQSKVDLGLNVTHYGQMAMRLDTSGALAGLDNALKKIEVKLPAVRKLAGYWLGTPPCV